MKFNKNEKEIYVKLKLLLQFSINFGLIFRNNSYF